MICLDGKKHVSFDMVNISVRNAKDSQYCMPDYRSPPMKTQRRLDRTFLEWCFCDHNTSLKQRESDTSQNMKPSSPNLHHDDVKEVSKTDFFHTEKQNVLRDNNVAQHLPESFFISKRTSDTVTEVETDFIGTHGDVERHKPQIVHTLEEKYDIVAQRGSSHHYCDRKNENYFLTDDSSHHRLNILELLKPCETRDLAHESTESIGNLQRRTNLICDSDDVDKDIYKCEKYKRTVQRNNSLAGSRLHNFLLWTVLKIGYIPGICGMKCGITTSINFSRKWAIFFLFTLLLVSADSKRALGNSLLLSPDHFCLRPRLSGKQHEICQNNSDILQFIKEAVKMGSHQCQKEFQLNRWNCSSAPRNFYSKLLQQDIRETAYVTALTSAALSYGLTKACTNGNIQNCGCLDTDNYVGSYNLLKEEAKKRHYKVNETELRRIAETFDWGGCHDQLEYGEYVSALFTENFGRRHESSDLRGQIEKHNLESGRKAVSNKMRESCQCHGVTGSCTLRTCWNKLPDWPDVRNHLRKKFDSAIKVQLANDGKSLLPTRKQRPATREYPPVSKFPGDHDSVPARPSRHRNKRRNKSSRVRRKNSRKRKGKTASVDDDDLVYSQESPNFCRKMRRHGTLGTLGRRCVADTTGAGSCDYLCCGRGHSTRTENVTYECNCSLNQAARRVICDNCTKEEIRYYCN